MNQIKIQLRDLELDSKNNFFCLININLNI